MSKRDYIGEILAKKERLSPNSKRLEQISGRVFRLQKTLIFLDQLKPNSDLISILEEAEEEYSFGEISDLTQNYSEIQYEAMRYIPIGLVACMEGYFRLAYADLINFGTPYRDNASEFDVKFSIESAIALERHSLSLGDFIAHLLTTNNLSNINHNMTTLIGKDFLEIFKVMRPKLETQNSLFEQDNEQVSNWVLGNVQRLFELRHLYSHEPDPPANKNDIDKISGGIEAVKEFLWVSDTIINEMLR